jgi:predicted TIM-barrel fold metal-dependent hydrolase
VIIDFHAHIRDGHGEPEALIEAMDRDGVDKMVLHPIIPTVEGVGSSSNEFVASVIQRFPDRFLGFACVQPTEQNAPAELERLVTTYGFRGLKLHPPIQQFDLRNPAIYPTLRKAEELGLPVLIHTGPLFVPSARISFGDPEAVDDLGFAFPNLVMIAAHADPLGVHPYIAGKHKNVYTDTAVVFDRIARLIPGAGEDMLEWMKIGVQAPHEKLLFGSDANPKNTRRMSSVLETIKSMKIDETAKQAILGGNAARLLRLQESS